MPTPIQKLAKLALDNPELRDDLLPILRRFQAGTYTPKDNWVLLDLAVQDAHKGKPDREWYGKDEGYTEVYDQTVKELKRKGRRATRRELPIKVKHPERLNAAAYRVIKDFEAGDISYRNLHRYMEEHGYEPEPLYPSRRAAHPLTQRDVKDAILNNHRILETLKADPEADPRWVAALEKQIEGLRRLLEQAEMKRAIQASKWKDVTGPPTTQVYDHKVDHGYDQPLSGGTDVMKRLQDQLLIEQGREPRPKNPRLAASHGVQRGLIAVLRGPEGREAVRRAVTRYAADTNTTVVVNAAVEDILENAVAVALDPKRMGAIIARHTAGKETP